MSSLWTPGGERPVGRDQPRSQGAPATSAEPVEGQGEQARMEGALSEEELRAQMDQVRRQLVDAPAEVIISNHCYALFELAALHLSQNPPQLAKAKLAIDGMSALLEGLAGRLGESEGELRDGLASLRLAYVQLQAGPGEGAPAEGAPAEGAPG